MKRASAIIIFFSLILALLSGCGGGGALRASADYLIDTAGAPQTGSPGGDWTVFALARSGLLPDSWRDGYYEALEAALDGGDSGKNRNTEYSRMALCVRAFGGNPRDVAGYDLLSPLEDAPKTAEQGVAGIAYALLALGEDCPSELREQYVEKLLSYQLPNGSFAPQGETEADADLTAICLQALSQIQVFCDVQEEISAALAALSSIQNSDGSFSNSGAPTVESTAQAVIALCSLGISPETDSRFVKDKSAFDALMGFYRSGGGFSHTAGGKANVMATEQALCALAAVSRLDTGEPSLFSYNDVGKSLSCSISVQCGELLDNLSLLLSAKHSLVPENGIIYENANAQFEAGESVFDLLRRELKNGGVHFEFTLTPVVGSAYIEGISNIYEFDCGELSGWLYSVNGEYPGVSCSEYKLEDGDEVVFEFVCQERVVSQ